MEIAIGLFSTTRGRSEPSAHGCPSRVDPVDRATRLAIRGLRITRRALGDVVGTLAALEEALEDALREREREETVARCAFCGLRVPARAALFAIASEACCGRCAGEYLARDREPQG